MLPKHYSSSGLLALKTIPSAWRLQGLNAVFRRVVSIERGQGNHCAAFGRELAS